MEWSSSASTAAITEKITPTIIARGRQALACCHILQVLHLRARPHVAILGSLAELQRAYIGGHCPALRRRELRRVVRHGAVPVSHYVKVVRQRLRYAHLVVEIGGRLVAALHNFPQAVAHPRVARRAVNVEPLLSALEHFH